MNLSPHFTLAELDREGIATPAEIAALRALCVDLLEPVRALLGVPLRVNSGLRSVAHNAAIGGAPNSQHLHGEAADVGPVGLSAELAMERIAAEVHAGRLPADQAIVYASGFLHLSHTTRRPNRGQLLRCSAPRGSGGPYVPYTGRLVA